METLQTNQTKKYQSISLVLRIILSALFLVSAIAKLYPSPNLALGTFETKQLVDGLGMSANSAAWFSRFLIGAEFALGFALLQKHYLRRLVFTLSIVLLAIFVGHLSYEIALNGNKGNCGCFGTLLPMTPMQAIIKNLFAIVALIYLYRLHKKPEMLAFEGSNKIITAALAILPIFSLYIIAPIGSSSANPVIDNPIVKIVDEPVDTVAQSTSGDTAVIKTDVPKIDTVAKKPEPKPKKSGFTNLFPDLDKGKKLLCFFAPGCDHCQKAAVEITQLKKKYKDFPQVRIAFMDEEVEKIPEFFATAGAQYTHSILDVVKFWTVFKGDTPGVYYFWNGNQLKYYQGTEESNPHGHFTKADLEKIIKQEYKP